MSLNTDPTLTAAGTSDRTLPGAQGWTSDVASRRQGIGTLKFLRTSRESLGGFVTMALAAALIFGLFLGGLNLYLYLKWTVLN